MARRVFRAAQKARSVSPCIEGGRPADEGRVFASCRDVKCTRSLGRSRVELRTACLSSTELLEQVYTGFGLPARKRLISLSVRRAAGYSSRPYSTPLLHVDVRGESVSGQGLRLTFDLEDHADLPPPARLEGTASCFSSAAIDPAVVSAARTPFPTFPLGLNYSVMDSDGFGLRRALWARNPRDFATMIARHSRWLSRAIPLQQSITTCSPHRFEGVPRFDMAPRVLLMARSGGTRHRDPTFRTERLAINTMRAECIRHLRRAFPSLFCGGDLACASARQGAVLLWC